MKTLKLTLVLMIGLHLLMGTQSVISGDKGSDDDQKSTPKKSVSAGEKKLNLKMPQRNPSSLILQSPSQESDPHIRMEFLDLDVTTDPNYGKH